MSLGNRGQFENRLISRIADLFVNRESLLEEFERRLNGEEQYLVINIYGIGGSGKTSLLRKFEVYLKAQREDKKKVAFSYLNFELATDVISSLLNLTEQLERHGLNFPLFYLALMDFYLRRGRREEAESLRVNRMQPLRTLGMAITDLAGLIGGSYLGVGVKWLTRTLLVKMTEARKRKMDYAREFLEFFEERPLWEQEALLGLALYEDIKHQSQNFSNLVLLFDTHEKFYEQRSGYSPECDYWFRQFLGNFSGMEQKVLCVIAGRERLAWEATDKGWKEKIKAIPLEKLSLPDSEKFLLEVGIPEEHRPLIFRTTEGLPLALYLSCLRYFQMQTEEKVDFRELEVWDFRSLCDRVFRHLWPETRKMLEMLSFASWFDREVSQEVARQCNISWGIGDFPSLTSYAFVKELKQGIYAIDRAVSDLVRQRFKEDYSIEFRSVHTFFLNLFKERYLKSGESDAESLKEAVRHSLETGKEEDLNWALEKLRSFLEKHFAPDFVIEIAEPRLKAEKEKLVFLPLLGEAYFVKGDYSKASECQNEALSLEEKTFGPESPEVARTLNKLGSIAFAQGDYQQAVALREKALGIQTRVLPRDSAEIARSFNNLGIAYRQLGDFARAIEYHEKALKIWKEVLGPDHLDVSLSLNSLGNVYNTIGDYDRAIEYYQAALEVRLKHLGRDHPYVAGSYNNLGLAYHAQGKLTQAIESHKKALEIKLKVLSSEHPEVAASYINLGTAYEDAGDYELALDYYKKALKIYREVFGEIHPYVAGTYENIGGILESKGQSKEALSYYSRSLNIRLRTLGEEHPDTALAYRRLGSIYAELGNYEEALTNLKRALALQRKFFGSEHPEVAETLRCLSSANLKLGDLESAYQQAEESLKMCRTFFSCDHPEVALSMRLLGQISEKEGKIEESSSFYREAYRIQREALGENHPETRRTALLLKEIELKG